MKNRKMGMMLCVIASMLLTNMSIIHAETYVGTKSNGPNAEALYYNEYTTNIKPMSDWYNYPVSGTIGISQATTKATSFSASGSVGFAWNKSTIGVALKSDYSASRTISINASWNISAKKKARIATFYYRRKAIVRKYNMDNQLLATFISYPAKKSSAIGPDIVDL